MAIKSIMEKGRIKPEEVYVQLGKDVIRHRGQATTTNTLGTVIVNAAEGMMTQTVMLPMGVTSVNKDYVMGYIKNKQTARGIAGHVVGDNQLKVGPRATPYLIAPGIVFVEHKALGDLKFEGKPIDSKEFSIPRNPNIHITEDEGIIIGSSSLSKGKGPRS